MNHPMLFSFWLSCYMNLYQLCGLSLQVDANVCITDWGVGASDGNYMQVASNTRVVGAVLSRRVYYFVCIILVVHSLFWMSE